MYSYVNQFAKPHLMGHAEIYHYKLYKTWCNVKTINFSKNLLAMFNGTLSK